MNNSYHRFNHSQKTEINSIHLHNAVYENLLKNYTIEIDRKTCDYRTGLGREYQQADTDTILKIICNKTNNITYKNVSEKTRNLYYNDIYMEIISVLSWNKTEDKFVFNKIGWGMHLDKKGPDYLSLLFLNKKEEKYTSLFIFTVFK